MKKFKLLVYMFIASSIIIPAMVIAQNDGTAPHPDETLQQKWEIAKTKYIKSFTALEKQIDKKVDKAIKKYSKKILKEDLNLLNERLTTVRNKNTQYLEELRRDNLKIQNQEDLTNRINTQKSRIKEIKNDIKIIYTELKIFLKINAYEALGTKIKAIVEKQKFWSVCDDKVVDRTIFEPMILLIQNENPIIQDNNARARDELKNQHYTNSIASLKNSKVSITRCAKNIKSLIKLCVY